MKNICYLLRAGEVESLVGRQDPQQELVQQLDRAAGVANTSAETGVIVHIYLGSQSTDLCRSFTIKENAPITWASS